MVESPKIPRRVLLAAEEAAALQWLERTGRYAGLKTDLAYIWYMKFVGCLKQPCGRVEKQGSQMHSIEMVLPSAESAEELLRPHLFQDADTYRNKKYTVDPVTRQASWHASKSTDTFRIEDEYQLGEYLSLHNRSLHKTLMLYDGSKLAPITKTSGYTHANVMMTFIPPLTLEVVRRRRPRVWVLKAELNSQVYNDLGGQMLPPFYEYGDGMDIQFKELALYHLSGMRRRGYPLSTNFLTLLESATPRPHTDDEGSDGDAESSTESMGVEDPSILVRPACMIATPRTLVVSMLTCAWRFVFRMGIQSPSLAQGTKATAGSGFRSRAKSLPAMHTCVVAGGAASPPPHSPTNTAHNSNQSLTSVSHPSPYPTRTGGSPQPAVWGAIHTTSRGFIAGTCASRGATFW